jgi:hypothetical protein
MGAFGNYSYNPKQEVDFSLLKTIPVVTTFNKEGKIRPDYFRLVNPDQSEETIKINAIKYTKEYNKPIRILFRCICNIYGRQFEVNLVFYVNECKWIVQ